MALDIEEAWNDALENIIDALDEEADALDELYDKYDEKTVENLIISEVRKQTLKLTQYKRPTNIIISKQELPKTTTRKVKRKEVKERLCV